MNTKGIESYRVLGETVFLCNDAEDAPLREPMDPYGDWKYKIKGEGEVWSIPYDTGAKALEAATSELERRYREVQRMTGVTDLGVHGQIREVRVQHITSGPEQDELMVHYPMDLRVNLVEGIDSIQLEVVTWDPDRLYFRRSEPDRTAVLTDGMVYRLQQEGVRFRVVGDLSVHRIKEDDAPLGLRDEEVAESFISRVNRMTDRTAAVRPLMPIQQPGWRHTCPECAGPRVETLNVGTADDPDARLYKCFQGHQWFSGAPTGPEEVDQQPGQQQRQTGQCPSCSWEGYTDSNMEDVENNRVSYQCTNPECVLFYWTEERP